MAMSVEGLDTFICGLCNVYFYDLAQFVEHKTERLCDDHRRNGQLIDHDSDSLENNVDVENEIEEVKEVFESGDASVEEAPEERYEEVNGSILTLESSELKGEDLGAGDLVLEERFNDEENDMMRLHSSEELQALHIVNHAGVETEMTDDGIVENQIFQICMDGTNIHGYAKFDAATGTYFIIEDYTLAAGQDCDAQDVVDLDMPVNLEGGDADRDCGGMSANDMVFEDDEAYNGESNTDYSEMISQQDINDTGIELIPMEMDAPPSYGWSGRSDAGLELQIRVKPTRSSLDAAPQDDEFLSSPVVNKSVTHSESNEDRPPPRKRGRPRLGEERNRMTMLLNKSEETANLHNLSNTGRFVCPRCRKLFTRARHFTSHRCLAEGDYIDPSIWPVKRERSGEEDYDNEFSSSEEHIEDNELMHQSSLHLVSGAYEDMISKYDQSQSSYLPLILPVAGSKVTTTSPEDASRPLSLLESNGLRQRFGPNASRKILVINRRTGDPVIPSTTQTTHGASGPKVCPTPPTIVSTQEQPAINTLNDSSGNLPSDTFDIDIVSKLRSIQQAIDIETLTVQRFLRTDHERTEDVQTEPSNQTSLNHKEEPAPVSVENEDQCQEQEWLIAEGNQMTNDETTYDETLNEIEGEQEDNEEENNEEENNEEENNEEENNEEDHYYNTADAAADDEEYDEEAVLPVGARAHLGKDGAVNDQLIPILRHTADRNAFDRSLDVDLAPLVDHMFTKHAIAQNENEYAVPRKRKRPASLTVYTCNTCQKVFMSMSHARLHCVTHTNTRPFKCHRCSFATNTKGNLYTHMRRHTGSLYRCSVCSFKTGNRTHLMDHEQTHSGERQSCNLCHRSYNTPKSLLNHVRAHHLDPDGLAYFKLLRGPSKHKAVASLHLCPVCNRKFKDKAKRDSHALVHSKCEQADEMNSLHYSNNFDGVLTNNISVR